MTQRPDELLYRVKDGLWTLYRTVMRRRKAIDQDVDAFNTFVDRLQNAGFDAEEWRISDESLRGGGWHTDARGRGSEIPTEMSQQEFFQKLSPLSAYLDREISRLGEGRVRAGSGYADIQEERDRLLGTFVEAYRRKREPFRALSGDDKVTVYHDGFDGRSFVPNWEDVEALGRNGRLVVEETRRGQWKITIPDETLKTFTGERPDGAARPQGGARGGFPTGAGGNAAPAVGPSPTGATALRGERVNSWAQVNPAEVWVIYGHDEPFQQEIFDLLRAVRLHPLEFHQAVRRTGRGAPFTLDAVLTGISAAPVVIALWTPDEDVELREDLVEEGTDRQKGRQPRPNVLIETGMALALKRDDTIVVTKDALRPASDVEGIHEVRWSDDMQKNVRARAELVGRLKDLGHPVDDSGHDWRTRRS